MSLTLLFHCSGIISPPSKRPDGSFCRIARKSSWPRPRASDLINEYGSHGCCVRGPRFRRKDHNALDYNNSTQSLSPLFDQDPHMKIFHRRKVNAE
ncbi:Uncharacterized protein HZ326_15807 [Fusarium oxysporum f. sp. albedinis]|nr:Uncharacterized protein HZ326_15807 [Fusarium oxysporum f. sp. albedinis]